MQKRVSEIRALSLFTSENTGSQSVGRVIDLLIEEGSWKLRYFGVQTEASLSRHVLVSHSALTICDLNGRSIETTLTATRDRNFRTGSSMK